MNIKFNFIIVLVLVSLFSCGPKKGIVTKKKSSSSKKTVVESDKKETVDITKKVTNIKNRSAVDIYIDLYADIAKQNMRTHKIPASVTLAQGILESGSGKGRLAVKANNHFGIKCHGWRGAKIYHDDDRSQECFRKYKRVESSYEDHSEFLTGRKRYAGLFNLKPSDYKGWATGLRAAGYATDRKYPQKLVSLIERYKLYEYDEEVLGKSDSKKTTLLDKNTLVKHTVVEGDTLYSLSRFYKTTVSDLKAINNLSSNSLTIGQQLIIRN